MNQQTSRRRSGQALVEYAMLMVMVLGVFTILDYQIRKNIGKIWTLMAKDITAGCPGCTAPDSIK